MIYDVVIVGGGPAGLASAIYTSKNKLTTLLIEKDSCGGKLSNIQFLNDYPGFNEGIQGIDLALRFDKQARCFGTKIIFDKVITVHNYTDKIKVINTISKISYKGRAIIIASGTHTRKLNIIGESQFEGKGISFCAMCDAQFYKGKDVVVIGSSNFAIKEAIHLSKFVNSVTIINKYNKLSVNQTLLDILFTLDNINIIHNTVVKKICGKDVVEQLEIYNVCTKKNKYINVNGIFISTGLQPNSSFIPNVILDQNEYIITSSDHKTSIQGLFACGDIRKGSVKQVITAVAEGVQAAISVQAFIRLTK